MERGVQRGNAPLPGVSEPYMMPSERQRSCVKAKGALQACRLEDQKSLMPQSIEGRLSQVGNASDTFNRKLPQPKADIRRTGRCPLRIPY